MTTANASSKRRGPSQAKETKEKLVTISTRRIQEQFTRNLLDELARQTSLLSERGDSEPRLAQELLMDAFRERATDIHIDPQSGGYRVRLRIDGELYDAALLTENQARRLINQFKTWAELDPGVDFAPTEARWTFELEDRMVHLRLSGVPCINGEKISIRVLDPRRVEHRLHDLGMVDSDRKRVEEWLESVKGAFLVAGPTGSGKTTTLYALLHELKQRSRSIVTIEDPVEYQIDGICQVQVDRRHDLTFAQGLRTILRLDTDFLMLGEIRDAESARAAIDASIGGRVLLSTLHSPDAAGAVTALRNWGLRNDEIAVNVSVIVAQRLVRVLCPRCKQRRPLPKMHKAWFEAMGGKAPTHAYQPVGCDDCSGTGYLGRTGVFEVWKLDESDYEMILNGTDERSLRQHVMGNGHRSLLADVADKMRQGVTSMEEIMRLPWLVLK